MSPQGILTILLITGAGVSAQEKKAFFDADFVRKTASGEIQEIEMAKLALSRAKHADIRAFAERMSADHAKVSKALRDMAKAANMTLPEKMNPDDQARYDELKAFSGDDFDRAYVKHLLNGRAEDVAEFDTARKDASSPLVRAFAEKNLPALRDHLEKIRALHESFR